MRLRDIAEHLGISQRLVEIELKHAVDHCAERLGKQVTRRFGPKPRQTSQEESQKPASPRGASAMREPSDND
jgi:hypothetical protein